MTPLEWLDRLQASGIRPGLSRMRKLLRAAGQPHRAAPAIIVAGTNGKGSTSAMLASILNTAGYRAGLYTSPHLVEIRERWMIGGSMIEAALLDESIDVVRAAGEQAGFLPTYFEALTLVAFVAFQRAGCEVAVLEAGMGGRLDATNVVHPVAAVITPIGFDHMEYLGNTIRKIAAEKAGVIHRGTIVLTSNHDETVLRVLRKRAERFGNAFHVVGTDALPGNVHVPLAGDFQRLNAALAIRTAEELALFLPKIGHHAIRNGVASTRWRGRLERLESCGKEIWIDGCHNTHAIAEVVPFVGAALATPRLLVFGIMSDKDVDEVTSRLFPLFDQIIATEPFPPRSVGAAALVERATALGIAATAEPSPRTAIERALASDIGTIFVGGSLYLAGEALAFLEPRQQNEKQK